MVYVLKGGAWGYPGGDARMAKHILRLAPPHKTFCEPFVGGGATTWAHPGDVQFVVGDFDSSVIGIWKDLKAGKLSDKLSRTSCVLGSDSNLKKLQSFGSKRTPLQNIMLWQMSLLGRTNGKISVDNALRGKHLCFTKLKRNVEKMESKMKDAKVVHGDYRKTIKSCDSKATFFYLDPPWVGHNVTKDYTERNFNPEEMFDFLQSIEGKFLMYHSFRQDIADLARDYGFRTFHIHNRHKNDGADNYKPGVGSKISAMGRGSAKSGYLFVSNYAIPLEKWQERI